MAQIVSIKVYNKEDKIKLLVSETEAIKTICIHKYIEDGDLEVEEVKYFFCEKINGAIKPNHAYYEFQKKYEGVLGEYIRVSEEEIESYVIMIQESSKSTSSIKTNTKLKSGNVYEERVKFFDGESFRIEYKNGELFDFKYPIQENKINEYLKILKDE